MSHNPIQSFDWRCSRSCLCCMFKLALPGEQAAGWQGTRLHDQPMLQELEREAQMLHKESLQLQDQAAVYAGQAKRAEERLDTAEASLAALRREAAESAGTMAEVLPCFCLA